MKEIGYWRVEKQSLYYSFKTIDDRLYGSKCFSIIREDWQELHFKEEIKSVLVESHLHSLQQQPGIHLPTVGPVIVRQSIQRISLPENGVTGNIEQGMYIFFV